MPFNSRNEGSKCVERRGEQYLPGPHLGHRLAETRDKLATRGMPCGVLHGGLDKHERSSEIAKFRRGGGLLRTSLNRR